MLKRIRFFVLLVVFGLVEFCDWVKSVVKYKMGTIIDNNDEGKRDLDDSGCVQDGSPQERMAEEEACGVTLLDLSDDVLLYILRHCAPRDLKALGFSCPRLGRLVRERSLWRRVDARGERCEAARLHWYVAHALHADTRQLYVQGYADESSGCLGIQNCSRQEADEEQKAQQARKTEAQNGAPLRTANLQRHHACFYVSAHSTAGLPRSRGSPLWADGAGFCRRGPHACSGPRFSCSAPLLRQLRARCPQLSRLALDKCNIDCNTMNLGDLPATLTWLSLRGSRCYNLPLDKSFLFKIQEHLPLLEVLDVSDCEWLEPAVLLPLSKHTRLRELRMRRCHRLAEFVAYASLSSRYGFRTLQVLDLRGSPVGDSEVAPLAWLPRLQELKLSAMTAPQRVTHGHYLDDVLAPRNNLDDWEMQEPNYFKESFEGDDMNVDSRSEVDGGSQRSGDDDDDNDGDSDDDDDNDMKGVGSDCKSNPGKCGESSDSKRDGVTTKRKANCGKDGTSVNGDQSCSKRKRSNKSDSSTSDDDCEDDKPIEPPKCETIVIVDRRYISENEDASYDRCAERYIRPPSPFMGRRWSYNDGSGSSRDNDRVDDKAPDTEESEKDNLREGNADEQSGSADNAKEQKEKVFEAKNADSDDKSLNAKIIDPNKGEKSCDDCQVDKKENDNDTINNCQRNDQASGSNAKRPKLDNNDAEAGVNRGASTSQDNPTKESGTNGSNTDNDNASNGNGNGEGEQFIRFRQGEHPVIVNRNKRFNIRREFIDNQHICNVEIERFAIPEAQGRELYQRVRELMGQNLPVALGPAQNPLEGGERSRGRNPLNGGDAVPGAQRRLEVPPPLAVFPAAEENREPRHRMLYVNVGQPANALGPLPNVLQGLVSDRELSRTHLTPSSLVTDAAVRRFGRAVGNDIRFVLVGIPHPVLPPNQDGSARPERSNLTVLVMNGYRNITDRSLAHLATAAPHLRLLDFRETSVTPQGVENFRSLRPDCEVLFSPYVERKVEWPDEDD